jgi:hypothetical protein
VELAAALPEELPLPSEVDVLFSEEDEELEPSPLEDGLVSPPLLDDEDVEDDDEVPTEERLSFL